MSKGVSKRIPPRPAQEKQRHMNKNPALPPLSNTYRAARTTDEDRSQPEPEMIPQEFEDDFAKENRSRFQVIQAEERRRREIRSLAAKVRDVGQLALKCGIDPEEFREIDATLDSLRDRLTRKAA